MEIERIDTNARMSRIVIHNQTVYLCGQVAEDRTSDAAQQTTQALAKVDALLARAGTDKSKLLTVTVYLADMADFPVVTGVYQDYFAENSPARACVQVAALPLNVRIEVDAIAILAD